MTEPILAVDIGTTSCAAAIVADERTALLRDPCSGVDVWPPYVLVDGTGPVAGAAAERRAASAGRLPAPRDDPGALTAYLTALATQARQVYGATVPRLVLAVPAGHPPTDPRRDTLVAAGTAAGFDDVELIDDAVAVALDPQTADRLPDAALVLVCDLGATWTVSCVHRRGDRSRLVAQHGATAGSLDELIAGGRAAVAAAGATPADIAAVVLAGGGAHRPEVRAALADAFGHPPRRSTEPGFAVVRGAARWAAGAAGRRLTAIPPAWRTEPVAWDIPGGRGHLLRWTVHLDQQYPAGALLAEVRTADGVTVGLTAHRAGALPGPLPAPGDPVGPVLAVAARRPAAVLAADPPRVLRTALTTGSYLLSADRHVLLECAADGTSVVSTAAGTGEVLGVFRPEPPAVPAVAPGGRLFVDPSGRPVLVAWDADAGVSVWDVETGKLTVRVAEAIGAHRAFVDESTWRLAVEGAARVPVGRYRRSSVTVWDLHTGGRLDERYLHSDWARRNPAFRPRSAADGLTAEAVGPDGRLHAAAGPDGVVLRDVTDGIELFRATVARASLTSGAAVSVAFDGDGSRLLVVTESEGRSRLDVLQI